MHHFPGSIASFFRLQKHGVLEQLLNMTATVSKSSESPDLHFPVSTEEFQLLSSLLCFSKPTQYLTPTQQEQIVYLACRLFEEHSPTLTDTETNRDLLQSIDHVAKHLFQKIDQTYGNQSTKNLFKLYFHQDLNNVIRKNTERSLHQRSIWLVALHQAQSTQKELIEQLTKYILSYVPSQSENDAFIDAVIAIGSEHNSFGKVFYKTFLERLHLTSELVSQSWIYGILNGWLATEQSITIDLAQDKLQVGERLIDVQFLCLFVIRQYELNSPLQPSNDELVKLLIQHYYLFQSRCMDTKALYFLFERLFRQPTFHIDFPILEHFSRGHLTGFYSELVHYHLYCQVKERYCQLNQRDDLLNYTMILDNNDEVNLHLFLASFFRESQLKLLLPNLIEQCQDERRSPLSLAALNQCLVRMNKCSLILDESSWKSILDILMKSSVSSKEVHELIQLWNTLLNHGTLVQSLEQPHWDHLLCFLGNLFRNLTNVQAQIDQQCAMRTEFLFIHGSNLLTTIGKLLTRDQPEPETDFPKKQLLEEWLLLYSKDIYQGLLPLYMALPSALSEFSSFYVTNEMVKSICSAICTIPTDYLLANTLKPLFQAEDNQSTLSESVQTVFNHLYRLLCLTANRSLQSSAYHLLNKLLPHVSSSLILTGATNNDAIAEDNKTCRLPASMLEALQRTEATIVQLLSENDIVEEHLLDDDGHEMISKSAPTTVMSDKEHIIIGELLNYKLLLNLIHCYSTNEQRYTYRLMLQEKKLVDRFLSIVLGLIPANPVYNDPLSMQVSSITKKLTHSKSMFEHDIQLNPNGRRTSSIDYRRHRTFLF